VLEVEAPRVVAVAEVEAPKAVAEAPRAVAEETRAMAAVEEPRAEVEAPTSCTVAVVAWPNPVAPVVGLHPPTGPAA
jgi:hypothetical protein